MPTNWDGAWYWGVWVSAMVCFARSYRFLPHRYDKFYYMWIWSLASSWALATGRLNWASANLRPDLDALWAAGWQSFALTLLLPPAVLLLPLGIFTHWRWMLSLLALAESLRIISNGYGWLNSASFGGAMLACTLPVLPWPVKIPVAAAALASTSVTASLALAASGAAYLFYQRWWKSLALYVTAALGAFWWAGPYIREHTYGRIAGWGAAARWLTVQAPELTWFTGTGLGSYRVLGRTLGVNAGEIWLQLHSDWFQILFEMGFFGLCLALYTFYKISREGFHHRNAAPLMSVWGLAAMGLTYYPLRSFWGMLFLLCLIREITENEPWPRSTNSAAWHVASFLNRSLNPWARRFGAPAAGTSRAKSS